MMLPADAARAHLQALRDHGWTNIAISRTVDCDHKRVSEILRGAVTRVQPDLHERIMAMKVCDYGCPTCDDIETALISSTDVDTVAERIGMTTQGLLNHLYRTCDRRDLAARFAHFDAFGRCVT